MALADAVRRLESSRSDHRPRHREGTGPHADPASGLPARADPAGAVAPQAELAHCLRMPGRVSDAVRAAADVLDRVDADVVVGFGGYVALPAYLAARRARLPIVVHEANARPGVANRLAARLTHHVYTASEQVRLPHAVAIGIPLRPAISSLDRSAMRPRARERVRAAARRADAAGHRRLAGRSVDQPGLRRSGGRPSPGGRPGAAHRRRQEHRGGRHRGSHRTRSCPSWSRCISPTRPRISCCAGAAR